ncbi:site-specific DNA-methyltransferase [Streptomyces lunaelactis]|uniref:site-specific DNA-methyltransferase n=1 Tax=Streptomyces lunaelactis TaxID=1535768 RepID=UPI001584BED7|nr:site-specific DNA-methyltransferase [Streptomyces lunaelactis]NUK09403.1 site-specific DNA-methyltransferase [Streptomyces lunaelactis]NUK36039.1 site-specific DNA-methyltransferase [Streptomyces lunaelactis]NUK58351.1 site-specific DNA-methyltransferase [Streptomyces lunaelactis]NUK94949.1 site-specific DNA-methyltransferase [Streptomyces lunaelactis]NUL11444.1 site-specific DNA-methyltransferase [Streptomyces lunaelactis]
MQRSGSNVLDDALARVRALDPALALTLTREVNALRESRKFGLVFEKHLPESVRLPHHPVKRGVKVARRSPAKGEEGLARRVLKVVGAGADRVAHLAGVAEPVRVADLVVVRDFGEPIYPGLKSIGQIKRGEHNSPNHIVINGENYHALQALRMTHSKAIDLIYIDPPYNTGNQTWIYNDKYVADQDAFKHSKWLSFMERRLTVSRDLLKDSGVIFVAIGDDEHHRLRMLMDQVFGPQNFLANIAWQGSGKNDARYTAGGVDYMLAYAKDEQKLAENEVRWRVVKPGINHALEAAKHAWEEAAHDSTEATKLYRAALRTLRGTLEPAVFRYDQIDDQGRVFQAGDLSSPSPRENLKYDLHHPSTGEPVRMPTNGWRFDPSTMKERLEDDRILFGPDETTTPRVKRLLVDQADQVPYATFTTPRMPGSKRVEAILGDKRFPFPKDHEVLMRWFSAAAPSDAVVLDFFGGSGSTTEAVMRLNVEDGGTRQSILVTNNEVAAKEAKELRKAGQTPGDPEWEANGVCRYVTMPRISTIVTGMRPDGSTYSEGLPANVEFFTLTYLDPDRVSRAGEFEAIAPLLWMQAGAAGQCLSKEPPEGWALADGYAVLTDIDASEAFVKALAALATPPPLVFVVTDSPSEFEAVAGRLPKASRPHQLYESYMRNFEINVEVAQ